MNVRQQKYWYSVMRWISLAASSPDNCGLRCYSCHLNTNAISVVPKSFVLPTVLFSIISIMFSSLLPQSIPPLLAVLHTLYIPDLRINKQRRRTTVEVVRRCRICFTRTTSIIYEQSSANGARLFNALRNIHINCSPVMCQTVFNNSHKALYAIVCDFFILI